MDVNLRQSAPPGNRNLYKFWLMLRTVLFENGTVQVRGLGLDWSLHGSSYEWRVGLISAVI
jgi:hypothetical protein